MRVPLRTALLGTVLAAAVAAIALQAPLGGDYPGPTCTGCDYAGPPIEALTHGDLRQFFATQPFMGSFSLVARAPFAALSHVAHGGVLWEYRAGLIPCLLALGFLVLALVDRMRRNGRGVLSCVVVAGLCLAGPMTFRAIHWGHPEELLGGALCAGAVLAGARGRSVLAGLLLGAAIATKQWALLAVAPTLLALPRGRAQTLAIAAGVAALFTAPMLVGDPGRFLAQSHAAGLTWGGVTPTNLWWPFGGQTGLKLTATGSVPIYAIPHWLAVVAHPLVVALAAGASLQYWRHRGERKPEDALELLALVFLIRCLLDPLTISYHHAPFVIALASFEAVRRRGLPLLSIFAATGLWSMSKFVAPALDSDLLNHAYVAWALPLTVYLGISVLAPGRARTWAAALPLPRPLIPAAE